ncbi:cell wall-binding repeat-containing protein [Egibacter rhizosphaerae]|nr:cell wall-binding repeat-containing protein [Egibacter rhizosphaerae]
MRPPRRAVLSVLTLSAVAVAATGISDPWVADAEEPTEAAGGQTVASSRLAGDDRFATAVAIAEAAYPDGADTAYLARADEFADALAAGALDDGPTLLTPSGGPVPDVVVDEVERLDPARVVALGGTAAVESATLTEAAGGRATDRLAGDDRFATAVAIAEAAYPDGADTVYLARADEFADSLAAGVIDAGPVLLARDAAPLPGGLADAIEALDPAEVVGLGGRSALSREVLLEAAEGRAVDRLDGRDRFDTAARVADEAAGTADGDASRLYLARADTFPDALAAGALDDGPLMLAPRTGPVSPTVLEAARLHAPDEVVALGSDAAIDDEVLAQVAAAAAGQAALRADGERLTGVVEPFHGGAPRLLDHLDGHHGQQVRLDLALRVDADAATRPFDSEPLAGATVLAVDGVGERCEPGDAGCAVDLAVFGVDDAATSLERHATSWRLRGAFDVDASSTAGSGDRRVILRADGVGPDAQREGVQRAGEAFADALRRDDRDAGLAAEDRRLRGSVYDRQREVADRFGGPDAYIVGPECGHWGCDMFAATHGGVIIEPRRGAPRVIGSPGEAANFVEISPDPPVPTCVTDPRGAPLLDVPGGVEMGRAGFGECSLQVVPGEDGVTLGPEGEALRSARWGVHAGVVPDEAVEPP